MLSHHAFDLCTMCVPRHVVHQVGSVSGSWGLSVIATAHGTTLVSSCPSRANQVGVHFISKVPIANDDIFERPNDLELARYFGPSHREEPKTGQIVFSNALIT